MKEFERLLKQYGTKQDDKYIIGVLVVFPYGDVWLKEEYKKNHFVGDINTLEELQEVCSIWNDKQLEEYG